MRRLHDIGVLPGRTVIIRTNPDGVELGVGSRDRSARPLHRRARLRRAGRLNPSVA